MIWTSLDTWIVIAAMLAGVASALVGSFLVLKKMSMMGDAISHAVLPGIAIAFILTGSKSGIEMFIGAAVIGVFTAVLIQVVQHFGRLEHGASMGVVFTVMFAVGLILIEQAAHHVDIHPEHVLFGAVELVPLYLVSFAGVELPRGVWVLGVVSLVNLGAVLVFFKELRLACFDPGLADALGIGAQRMHYLIMVLVALTTVAAFEVVGSILVIAMLIVPGSVAHLLTKRLVSFLFVAVGTAAAAALLGHVAVITIPPLFGFEDTGTAAGMTVVLGALFFAALLLAPENGLLARAMTVFRQRLAVARQDVLGLLWRSEEKRTRSGVQSGRGDGLPRGDGTSRGDGLSRSDLHAVHASPFVESPLMLRLALISLMLSGHLRLSSGRYLLSSKGYEAAQKLLRSHRLWERFFFDEAGAVTTELHPAADYLEHYTDIELQEALANEYAEKGTDPHGNTIPD